MDIDDVIGDFSSVFSWQFRVLEVEVGHRHQCLLGPREEPIYGGAGDEPWEVSASDSERASCRRHGEYNMEVVSSLLNEEVPKVFFGLLHALTLGLIFDLVAHVLLLLLVEKSRHHSDGQQIVDQLQEALLKYVGIGEEEEHWAFSQHSEKVLKVLSELFLLVASCQGDAEELITGSEES